MLKDKTFVLAAGTPCRSNGTMVMGRYPPSEVPFTSGLDEDSPPPHTDADMPWSAVEISKQYWNIITFTEE